MDYYESAEGVTITKQRAVKELEKHGADVVEFFTEVGERDSYKAQDVLHWLGY